MINAERYRKVDEIFQAALELDPADRAAFINSACTGDESLREEVEALLASVENESDIRDVPIPELAALFLPDQHPELSVGERLGHYEILSLLGTGGMGHVYLAQDSRLGRKVAIKLLPGEFTNKEASLIRFQQEARAASALNHPSILTIHDIGEIDGRRFIATEFIDGETLRERIQRGGLNNNEVLEIAVQVASAMAAAHQGGIIHRDIKPENIMLRRDGLVKVLDFGLATLGEDDSLHDDDRGNVISRAAKGPGLLMGTLPYMSPEQLKGESVDVRSDIFSLGVVLYELCTGQTPFNGDSNISLVASIIADVPNTLPPLPSIFGTEFERIVGKALIKNKESRYQRVEDLLDDLKRLKDHSFGRSIIEGSSSRARITPTLTRGYAAKVLLVVAVSAGALAILVLMKSIVRPSEPASRMRITALTGIDKCVRAAISRRGNYIVYVVQDSGKQSLGVRNLATNINTQVVPPAKVKYEGLTFSPDDSSIYYVRTDEKPAAFYRIPIDGGNPDKIIADVGNSVAFSSDGERIAFVRRLGNGKTAVVEANADGSGEQVLAERLLPEYFSGDLDWSPDGKIILCSAGVAAGGRYANVVGIEAQPGGAVKEISSKRWGDVAKVAWLRDGRSFVLSASEGDQKSPLQLWRVSYPAGDLRKITNDLNNYDSASLTADSNTLVTIRFEWRTGFWKAQDGDSLRAVPITSGNRDLYRFVSWTPDGKLVYPSDASGHRDIWLMEADGTEQKQLTADAGNNLHSSASRDGRYIVFSSSRNAGTYNIWRMGVDGTNPLQLTQGSGVQPRCSPDGRWVIYTSGGPETDLNERTLWRVPIDGGDSVQLTDRPSNWPDASPDGKFIACWYKDDSASGWQIAVLPFEGREPIRLFKVQSKPDHAIRWTPDGQAVTFIVTQDGLSNIWRQELAGGPPRQVTQFTSEEILCFDWSNAGTLVCSRVSIARDLVLIRDFL